MTIRETVEYCQWNEVISENGEVKYEKGWFDKVIPSNKFKKSHEYYNPNRTDYSISYISYNYPQLNRYERTTSKIACSAFDIDGKLLYDVVYIYDIK